jgi:hypothetical protein
MVITYYTLRHLGRRITINLTLPDLGHPDKPGLYEEIRAERWRIGLIECPQGHAMYIQERDRRPVGIHVRHADESECRRHATAGESDEHKALKERIARTATEGGHSVEVESRAAHGKRVTDVLVRGREGLLLGCEVQLSGTTRPTVRKRSNIAHRDGITPLWTFTERNSALVEAVPSARIDAMPWHDIASGVELPVGGGLRRVTWQRCSTLPTVCPVQRRGRCGGWHERFEPVKMTLDSLINRAAERQWVPIRRSISRSRRYWYWVPAEDAERLNGLDSPTLIEPDSGAESVAPKRPDFRCFYQASGGSPVLRNTERLLAALQQVHVAEPAPPNRSAVVRGVCDWGWPICGADAVRYINAWRCDTHRPRAHRRDLQP